jgi:hypothetical protein
MKKNLKIFRFKDDDDEDAKNEESFNLRLRGQMVFIQDLNLLAFLATPMFVLFNNFYFN